MTAHHQHHQQPPNVLIVGTGEYVTGYVNGQASASDKPLGIVFLSMLALRSRGKIGRIALCGTKGSKFESIRQYVRDKLTRYRDLDDTKLQEFECFPRGDVHDPRAYIQAMDEFCKPKDCVIIFTPDHTHYEIALEALKRELHVLVAKPAVQQLSHHLELARIATENQCICAVEVHKRWDPMYADARERIAARDSGDLGDYSYFSSYMSQPAHQLDTFRAWASKSDISYYLNSHHIDFHCWSLTSDDECDVRWRPVRVYASSSTGVAHGKGLNTEDTIVLSVDWHMIGSEATPIRTATATYTASWVAPKAADVHSQQRFHFMGTDGEVTIDQAHRGYSLASANTGYRSVNPLFMKYTPDRAGNFAGFEGYGFRSLATFVEAASQVRKGDITLKEARNKLASLTSITTKLTTAILEAGRISLDRRTVVSISYDKSYDMPKFVYQ